MSQLEQRANYDYRVAEPADRDGYLALRETVWGRERSREWFRWRFVENPYVDETPMIVADRDGTIVGAEPCLAFRLRVGDESRIALQPADWAVHPDHRRRGVFSGMTERLVESRARRPGELYFNFPNEMLEPGLEKFDWELRPGPTTYYRIQRPRRVLEQGPSAKRDFKTTASRWLGRLATPPVRGYLRVRDQLRTRTGLAVERHDERPVGTLTRLATRAKAPIHVVRDRAYYEWRFDNPRWETTTYIVRRDGVAVAACVVCREERGGLHTTAILDTVPRDGSAGTDAFHALLGAIVEDATDSDVLKIGDGPIPACVLARFGFWPNDEPPISRLATQSTLAVRPVDGPESGNWEIDGIDPTTSDWSLSLADQDVA
jgi:hypothetical protein